MDRLGTKTRLKMAGMSVALAMLIPISGSPAALGDPTRPPGYTEPAPVQAAPKPVQWRLSMVKVSARHRSAVLNGRVVREGDTIESARVVEISSGAVLLERAGEHVRVKLEGRDMKRMTAGKGGEAPR